MLAGLALTIGLVLYACARISISFIRRGKFSTASVNSANAGSRSASARWRDGDAGSVQRDPNSLKVTFTIYDAEGQWMSLTKAFCRICSVKGRACGAGRTRKRQSYPRERSAGEHDENYTPPEVEKAMEANHRRRRVFIRTQHHDARNW